MSEFLNKNPDKEAKLKKIVKDLHSGKTVEEVRKDFSQLIKNVSAEEISHMEQALINEGFPVDEVQRLCDVHVSVFEKSLKKQGRPNKLPGHPVHTYIEENKACKKIIKELGKKMKKLNDNASDEIVKTVYAGYEKLKMILVHYTRKENQLFPYLEETGFTGPSKVMWGKHDEIRALFKKLDEFFEVKAWNDFKMHAKTLFAALNNMIFMEERILFPTSLRKLKQHDWVVIKRGEHEIGYAWVTPGNVWDANMVSSLEQKKAELAQKEKQDHKDDSVSLDEGFLSHEQVNLMLKNLPFDITYVDENDKVLYYTASDERIFPRSPAIIGRDVHNCHPPKSVHVVEKILDSFKKKVKKVAEFWLNMNDKTIHIRYFPIYDKAGTYKGVIEVSQDITPIKALEGEKRLLDWE